MAPTFKPEELQHATGDVYESEYFTYCDVIAALANDLGQGANDLSTAKLLLDFSNVGDPSTNALLNAILRTSSGDTVLDGTNLFISLLGNQTVQTIRGNGHGAEIGTEFSVLDFEMTTTNLTLVSQGRVKLNEGPVVQGKRMVDNRRFPHTGSASLTGTGSVGTNAAVAIGTLTLAAPKVEVQNQ